MKLFKVGFNGRPISKPSAPCAVTWPHIAYVSAENEEGARLKLYDRWDHISKFVVLPTTAKAKISRNDPTITIIYFDKGEGKGWHLERNMMAGSPLELIKDETTRELVIHEANSILGW